MMTYPNAVPGGRCRLLSGLLAAAAVLLGMVSAGAASAGDPPRSDELDISGLQARLDQAIKNSEVASAEFLLLHHGTQVFHRTVGVFNTENQDRLPERPLYRIASMSKPITAVAALQLIENDRLGLDDPVSKYVPAFANAWVKTACQTKGDETSDHAVGDSNCTTETARDITIADLLRHTAAMPYPDANADDLLAHYVDLDLPNGAFVTPYNLEEFTALVSTLPLAAQPGKQWDYGLASDVLARVIEIACSCRFSEYLKAHILAPLEMDDTVFRVGASQAHRLLPIHEHDEDGELKPVGPGRHYANGLPFDRYYPKARNHRMESGGGGLVSSVTDYARFAQMLLAKGRSKNGRLLGADSVDLMRTAHVCPDKTGIPGIGFGFGLGVRLAKCPGPGKIQSSEMTWQGIFFTGFWVDFERQLVGVFMAQHRPDQRSRLIGDLRRESARIIDAGSAE